MKLKNIHPVILISFLFVFGSCAFFALASDSLSQKQAVFQDSDKDGLSDDEEKVYGTDPANADSDGDSYSDGVEVRSGYDPMKPAPGDRLASPDAPKVLGESSVDDSNMTSKLSEKLTNFIKENEGKEGEMSVEDLDNIIQSALGDKISTDESVSFDESLIKVKKQDYSSLSEEERKQKEEEDARSYFKAVLYVLVSNIPGEIASEEDLSYFFEDLVAQTKAHIEGSAAYRDGYFTDLADRGKIVRDQINSIEVPESLLDLHKEGLQLMAQALNLEEAVTIDQDDQIGLIVNISKIQAVIDLGSSFQANFTSEMDRYGIESGAALIFAN